MTELEPNARIARREDLTESLCILYVRPERGPPPDFVPGQFARIALPDEEGGEWVRRSYSIASAPGEPEVEIYLQLVDGGVLSERLRPLGAGARLWLDPRAHGTFTLAGFESGKDLIAVATGTGVAPFLSMLRAHEHDPPWRRFVLLHGVRLERELGYRGLLEERAARDPGFVYLPTVTREPEGAGWRGQRGRVQAVFEPGVLERETGVPLDPAECHVYLCGNPVMIDQMRELMLAQGFRTHSRKQAGNLHYERYW